MDTVKWFLVAVAVVLSLLILKKKFATPLSKFGNSLKSKLTKTTTKSEESTSLDNLSEDTVLIIYADWCGYCKQLKEVFKKAVQEGKGKIVMVNSDIHSDYVKNLGVRGFPTIMKVNGDKHTGERTLSDILHFAGV